MENLKKKPEIRFTGFDGNWEKVGFKEIVDLIGTGKSSFNIISEESNNNPYPILGSRSIIGYDTCYDYSGDFILTARVGENAGKLYRFSGDVKISDNTVFIKGNDLDYVFYTLTNFNLEKLSFGTGQPLIKSSELMNLRLFISQSKDEQTQIGKFFQNLDELLSQHKQKLEKLKILKKAMLEKMFPKEGESVPEIRFKGFSGDWEERSIKELALISTGFPFDSKDFSEKGEYTVITNGNIQNETQYVDSNEGSKIDIESDMSHFILNKGDILITMDGTVGRSAKVIDDKLILAQRVARLVSGFHTEFLYQLLNTGSFFRSMRIISTGGTIKHISLNDIANFLCYVPKDSEESTKIGNYFQNLDDLITNHQKQIVKFENIKKACLSKMFI